MPISARLRTVTPWRLHVREHGKATRSRLVVASAECLTGRNDEVPQARNRRMVRGADVEWPLVDRLHILLAERDPVGVGQFLDDQFRRFIGKQRADGGLVRECRLALKPRFKLPGIRLVGSDLPAAQHDGVVPVLGILMRDEGCAHDFGCGAEGDFPAHLVVSLAS